MTAIYNENHQISLEVFQDKTEVYIDRFYTFCVSGDDHSDRAIEKIPLALDLIEKNKPLQDVKLENSWVSSFNKMISYIS